MQINTKFLTFVFISAFALSACEPRVIKMDKKIIKDTYEFNDMAFPAQTAKPWLDEKQICNYLVDVDFENKNKTVFLDLETLQQHHIDHDAWDIAIMLDDDKPYVITNSGDYGSGVTFAKLSELSDAQLSIDKYSPDNALGIKGTDINQVSFARKIKTPYQKIPNPISNALINKEYYLIHSWDSHYMLSEVFAIRFQKSEYVDLYDYKLEVTKYTIEEVEEGVEDAHKTLKDKVNKEPYKIEFKLDNYKDYTAIYIKLNHQKPSEYFGDYDPGTGSTSPPIGRPLIINKVQFIPFDEISPEEVGSINKSPACYTYDYPKIKHMIPRKDNWHLEFNRINVYSKEMGELMKNNGFMPTSSILSNLGLRVKVASLYGWDYPEVTKIPKEFEFRYDLLAIGSGYVNPIESDFEKMRKAWYFSKSMPPTFYLNQNTYIIKTPKGYAKFRPGSFYGPSGEKFFMRFRHQYMPINH